MAVKIPMLQPDLNQQQVKISLQQDLNYCRKQKQPQLSGAEQKQQQHHHHHHQQQKHQPKQQPDFETGISGSGDVSGCGLKDNYHKCGLKINEKILHNYNNYELR